jgi:hypothetical protein
VNGYNSLYAGQFANLFLLAGEAAAAEQLAVAEQLAAAK